jgi:hypothetical protein
MVKCLSAFLDFCYIARRNFITAANLDELKDALARFHHHREIFVGTAGVTGDRISLPRQHSLMHYIHCIRLFGSPNGLCSSITESKHIKAVKEPWRRSNRHNPLTQILLTNSRMDKLAAAWNEYAALGMMDGTTKEYTAMIFGGGEPIPRAPAPGIGDDEGNDNGPAPGPKSLSSIKLARVPRASHLTLFVPRRFIDAMCSERRYPRSVEGLAKYLNQPQFPNLLHRFLYDQAHPDVDVDADVPIDSCPSIHSRVYIYHSAVAQFYAPSDQCGPGGMHRETIRSNPKWRAKYKRQDTVFVETDPELSGMAGLTIARLLLLFSFKDGDRNYSCALVHWMVRTDEPDPETGMWVVQPEYKGNKSRALAIIHLDCIARGAHLIPVYGTTVLPPNYHYSDALDMFCSYFVNPYVDHHSHELLK